MGLETLPEPRTGKRVESKSESVLHPPIGEPRFPFGENWRLFLNALDERRMQMARESLQTMLAVTDLKGMTFIDAGSGSGLFSLAAAQLGAAAICSFDRDVESVACTMELKRRFFPELDRWTVLRGDCLDKEFLSRLEPADVVYSWGVLHHTGDMWRAIENVSRLVKSGGLLFISIYNDQGRMSDFWRSVKRLYCKGPVYRSMVTSFFLPSLALLGLIGDVTHRRNPLQRYREPRARGMSTVRDWYDWLGGYPFEVARPEVIFRFLRDRGFVLREFKTVAGGWGCNEFVFRRETGEGSF